MEILLVTSNKKKTESPSRVLNKYGITVRHWSPEPEIIEIQAENAGIIAKHKALDAFTLTGKPVFCIDSAFHVDALNGFPGVFMKQVTAQIGAVGYLKLLRNRFDDSLVSLARSCEIVDAIAYMDYTLEEPEIFVRRIPGKLAREEFVGRSPRAKSRLYRIFIPEGETKTLAAMTDEEYAAYRQRDMVEGVYHELAGFIGHQ